MLEENKIAWRQRARLTQPLQLIKAIYARLQSGVTAVANLLNGEDIGAQPTRSMATILAENATRRHNIPTADTSEAESLNRVIKQMANRLYPGKGTRLFKGKDGLFAIFCGFDDSKWCLSKARTVCKERLYRTIFTCNKGQLQDENWSWKTHFLLGAWDCLVAGGVDPFTAWPLTWVKREPHRGSFGHDIHDEPMLSGFSTSDPTDISDFDIGRKNIVLESWLFNAFKSIAPLEHIQEAIARVVTWFEIRQEASVDSHLPSSPSDRQPGPLVERVSAASHAPAAPNENSLSLPAVDAAHGPSLESSVSHVSDSQEEVIVLSSSQVRSTLAPVPDDLKPVPAQLGVPTPPVLQALKSPAVIAVPSVRLSEAREAQVEGIFERAINYHGSANDTLALPHNRHPLVYRQIRELDSDGHPAEDERYLEDDTILSYLQMIGRRQGPGWSSHLLPRPTGLIRD
ncbi:hypothetical protein QFC22_001214 [Naganishia vaughanmartiniae]|uniref:Uncharacterized protein n=1 Tax=Naganishia vaughanmartiniae TaxID=1424756 RepID=A0ACC2XLA6_9TREE|nr:hypothetical protein QFC22_001214 [Naganishia vaughanmartiniae]